MIIRTTGERLFGAGNALLMVLLCLTILYPFANLLAMSFSRGDSPYLSSVSLIPRPFTTKSYELVFEDGDLYWGFLNTVLRTVFGTAASVVIMLAAAYSLSKKYLPHRNFYTSAFVFTLFFGGGLIPTYLLVRSLGLVDTRLVLSVANLVPVFHLLIMRNFLMSTPEELEDSARIDGANDVLILFRVVVPLSMPVIATIGLWTAVSHWNAWFDSLIYINDDKKHVLQIWLRRIVIEATDPITARLDDDLKRELGLPAAPSTIKAAALFVAMAPILVVYPFIQKYFVKGVILGSLKG
jgi:putative aldouronate transport system permease protein